jgi:mono/diheme cytochrome c family protein
MKNLCIMAAVALMMTACQPSTKQKPVKLDENAHITGQEIFQKNCVACHGAAGDLGASGAKNLKISVLPKDQIITQVTNGKGMMSSFKNVLSAEEINKVADYVLTLRK